MTVRFGRSAAHGEDDLRLQFLDVPDPSKIDARTLAETLVRFNARHLDCDDIMDTVEHGTDIDAKRLELVPRLSPVTLANDRLNATQRPITHEVDESNSVVELEQDSSSCFIRELLIFEILD